MIVPNLQAATSVQTPGEKYPAKAGGTGNELYESGVTSDLKEADENNQKKCQGGYNARGKTSDANPATKTNSCI